jgi:polar amino acid transport system substrate-binding protein
MKKFWLFLLTALTLIVLAACGSDEVKEAEGAATDSAETTTSTTVDQIKENGKIRVAVFSDKPPFGYVDENGKNQGYDIVLAKRVAKDLLGDENALELVLTEPAARVDLLKSDKVDLVLANFTVTPERSEQVDFAHPYMKVAIGVVSPEGALVTTVEELKDKKLIVVKGTTAEAYFLKNHPDIELLKFDQNTEAFEALKDGRGEALAQDNALLFGWANSNEGFKVALSSVGDVDYIAPAVQKGNEALLTWVNEELETLFAEGFFTKAYDETLKPAFGNDIKVENVIVEEVLTK